MKTKTTVPTAEAACSVCGQPGYYHIRNGTLYVQHARRPDFPCRPATVTPEQLAAACSDT